jgi:tartrate-resistant acid phosphatase type 5
MLEQLVPCFEQEGVRLVLSGHEHNFQYAVHRDVHYFVSGAGGKLREEPPDDFASAHTEAWAAVPHFLLIRIQGADCTVWPVSELNEDDQEPRCIAAKRPDGSPFPLPIRIRL